ncbi:ABC transporter permease [Thermodesulfobium sp. 4217-1]|uniref:ABC transporter permease n=1 Tax=Thermodesulfobium sp. 4217-1 TaxID=3120013 RepID=UPI0032214F7C
MIKKIIEIYRYREMLRNLVSKELQARYKNSVLGFFWTFLNPLLMLAVYTFVFSTIMKSDIKDFSIFLFIGLLAWNYIAGSVLQGTGCLVANSSLLKKVYFPREVIPLSIVFANMINYILSMIILLVALLISGIGIHHDILFYPVILLVQTIFLIPLVLILSVVNVYFRDLEHTVNVLINLWFFTTPIVYPISIVPEHLRIFFYLNPATHIVEAYLAIMYYRTPPNLLALFWMFVGSIIFFWIGFLIFDRLQRRVAEEV